MEQPFPMGITFPVDIKSGAGEKSISPRQVRYAIRLIYMHENNHLIWVYL